MREHWRYLNRTERVMPLLAILAALVTVAMAATDPHWFTVLCMVLACIGAAVTVTSTLHIVRLRRLREWR